MAYLSRFTFAKEIKEEKDIMNIQGHLYVHDDGDMVIINEVSNDEILLKLNKEIEFEENEIRRCEGMLNNPNFVSKAPKEKVDAERNKLKQHQDNLASLLEKKAKL